MDYRTLEEERQARRLPESAMDAVKVRSLNEIKGVLAQLMAATTDRPVTLQTAFQAGDKTMNLSVDTKSKNQRELIYEGLLDVKKKMEARCAELYSTEVNGKSMKPTMMPDPTQAFHHIDPLISRYTGGSREGYYICWTLSDGYKYKYDIFEHKLTREAAGTAPTSSI